MVWNSMIRKVVKAISYPFRDRISVWNGVAVRDVPFFSRADYRPVHKEQLWQAVRSECEQGDAVTFVGGGKGVVPVKAAEYGCSVTVIEAAEEMIEQLESVATLNRVQMRMVHGLVEAGHDVYGDASSATHLNTEDLEGDCLVLDCEGAENDILPAPEFDTVIVETHPQHGARTDTIRQRLSGTVTHAGTARHAGDILIRS